MSNRVVEYALWLGVGWFFACSTSSTVPTDDGGAIPDDGSAISDVSSEAMVEDAVTDSSLDLAACMNRPPPPPALECIGCPGERPGGNCVLPQPDGGIYGRCREEGELINGKVVGAYCCNRGDAAGKGWLIPSEIVSDAGMCTPTAPPDLLICSVCGDGICADWENRCNCARDCS